MTFKLCQLEIISIIPRTVLRTRLETNEQCIIVASLKLDLTSIKPVNFHSFLSPTRPFHQKGSRTFLTVHFHYPSDRKIKEITESSRRGPTHRERVVACDRPDASVLHRNSALVLRFKDLFDSPRPSCLTQKSSSHRLDTFTCVGDRVYNTFTWGVRLEKALLRSSYLGFLFPDTGTDPTRDVLTCCLVVGSVCEGPWRAV